jgi:uncharacterized protein YecE (DUF72 family)
MSADIRVGTSGWNYPAGHGTWNGVFYPARRPRGFDELAYYAEHFDTVEVNSTFYRPPDPAMSARWVERTPPGFVFSIKLYQKFTHPDMYLARDGVTDWDLSIGDIEEFRRGADPIAAAGRLAAVLIQFPPSFHAEPATREYLEWLLAAFPEYPLAVELRHRSWSDEAAETRGRLAQGGASWVLIDEPKFKDSVGRGFWGEEVQAISAPQHPVYIRLHGRNAAAWWEHGESEDRYNYLYSRAELAPFARIAKDASRAGRRVLMYMNNHFSAKSVANAAVLKHELGQPLTGEYPPELVARYPELNGVVPTSGLPL